jgi:hypothetical protein
VPGRRASRIARGVVLALGLGGLTLMLAACTLDAPSPQTIPSGTSTGQAVSSFTLRMTPSDGGFTTQSVDFQFAIEQGRGSVALTAAADGAIVPQTTGTVDAPDPCYATTGSAPTIVCPRVSHATGTGTLTISGVRVNSTGAGGELAVIVHFPPATTTSAVVAAYSTFFGSALPTFHSPSSTTFAAGHPGHFWVVLHGDAILSLEGAPSWLSISPHAGYLHGTPPANAAGRYVFTISAQTDPRTKRRHTGNLTAKQLFTLVVVKP